MPTIEQVLYGTPAGQGKAGRSVLARSPGVSRDLIVEITRLCEGWGKVPPEGVRRPILLSFPLHTSLSSLQGRLFAVVRIARGMDPLYHAVILNESDYGVFGRNPFRLAAEGIFVDEWDTGQQLGRREVAPDSLAPLISPLPSEADIGLVDEALRQILANGRLLLPLAAADERSDRLIALMLTSLPLVLKRSLRFASWAASETNAYTLAAVATKGARLPAWSRFLMTKVCGKLAPHNEKYVQQILEALKVGSIDEIEELSLHGRVDLNSAVEAVRPPRPDVLTATVSAERRPPAGTAPTAVRTKPLAAVRERAPRRPEWMRPEPLRVERPVRRPRRRTSRRARILVTLFALALLLAGAAYLLDPTILQRVAGRTVTATLNAEDVALTGGVDVGAVLMGLEARLLGGVPDAPAPKPRILAELRDGAAAALSRSGRDYVAEVDQCAAGEAKVADRVTDLRDLSRRGAIIERELFRLELGAYALIREQPAAELAVLPAAELRERWDALNRADGAGLISVRRGLEQGDLVADVRRARRQAAALADVIDLLEQPRRDNDWAQRLESVAERIPARVAQPVRRYRDAAFALARLKRAENAARFERLAFADDYAGLAWLPESVRAVVERDLARAASGTAAELPELVAASRTFYAELDRLAAVGQVATPDEMQAYVGALAANRAVRFDPITYADHVDRARLVLAEQLTVRGAAPQNLPDAFFPGGDRDEALDFLANLDSRRSPEAWQALGDRVHQPFFARWARHAGEQTSQVRRGRVEAFDAAFAEVTRLAEQVNQRAAAGQDWGLLVADLGPSVAAARAAWDPAREDRPDAGSYLERLRQRLDRPLPVLVAGVTIRLEPTVLVDATDVILELQVEGGATYASAPFSLGPAAPAGTGWVGSCDLNWRMLLPPEIAFVVTVRRAGDATALLAVDYASLLEGVGVSALPRPRRAEAGSVAFRLAEDPGRLLGLPATP